MSTRTKDTARDKAEKGKEKAREKDRARDKEKPRDSEGSSQRFTAIRRFIRETRSELKKVVWPTRETAINLTMIVIAVSAGVGLFLGTIDFLFKRVFELLVGGV